MRVKKRLYESEAKEHTIVYVYNPKWEWQQSEMSDNAFEWNFDDMVVWNSDLDLDSRIKRAMVEMIDDDPDSQNLAEYVDDYLADKVTKIDLHWDTKREQLIVTVHLAPGVNPYSNITYTNYSGDEVTEPLIDLVKDYLGGQMSDGWGEGFEQQEIAQSDCECVYNTDDDTDCQFFGDYREAQRYLDEQNEGSYAEVGDDDEDEDEEEEDNPTYDSCTVYLHLYCHFWDRRDELCVAILVDGRDEDGFDREGRDAEGFDRYGYDKDHYDREGFDHSGFNRQGFDKEGFNRSGRDVDGFDRNGERDLADNRPKNSKGVKNGALFTQNRDGTVRIRNTFDMGESRKRASKRLSESYDEDELMSRVFRCFKAGYTTPEEVAYYLFETNTVDELTDMGFMGDSPRVLYDIEDAVKEVWSEAITQ